MAKYNIGDCVNWQVRDNPVYQGIIKAFVGNGVTIFDFQTQKNQTILLSDIKEVIYSKSQECPDCNGKWRVENVKGICSTCRGCGYVSANENQDSVKCPDCNKSIEDQTIEKHQQEESEQKESPDLKVGDYVIWFTDYEYLGPRHDPDQIQRKRLSIISNENLG